MVKITPFQFLFGLLIFSILAFDLHERNRDIPFEIFYMDVYHDSLNPIIRYKFVEKFVNDTLTYTRWNKFYPYETPKEKTVINEVYHVFVFSAQLLVLCFKGIVVPLKWIPSYYVNIFLTPWYQPFLVYLYIIRCLMVVIFMFIHDSMSGFIFPFFFPLSGFSYGDLINK